MCSLLRLKYFFYLSFERFYLRGGIELGESRYEGVGNE